MSDSDAPDVEEYFQIHVKMPASVRDDPSKVQDFLTALANKINEKDGNVSIVESPADPVIRAGDGSSWAKGTLAVPMLGCGSKKPDLGDEDQDDDQG